MKILDLHLISHTQINISQLIKRKIFFAVDQTHLVQFEVSGFSLQNLPNVTFTVLTAVVIDFPNVKNYSKVSMVACFPVAV